MYPSEKESRWELKCEDLRLGGLCDVWLYHVTAPDVTSHHVIPKGDGGMAREVLEDGLALGWVGRWVGR